MEEKVTKGIFTISLHYYHQTPSYNHLDLFLKTDRSDTLIQLKLPDYKNPLAMRGEPHRLRYLDFSGKLGRKGEKIRVWKRGFFISPESLLTDNKTKFIKIDCHPDILEGTSYEMWKKSEFTYPSDKIRLFEVIETKKETPQPPGKNEEKKETVEAKQEQQQEDTRSGQVEPPPISPKPQSSGSVTATETQPPVKQPTPPPAPAPINERKPQPAIQSEIVNKEDSGAMVGETTTDEQPSSKYNFNQYIDNTDYNLKSIIYYEEDEKTDQEKTITQPSPPPEIKPETENGKIEEKSETTPPNPPQQTSEPVNKPPETKKAEPSPPHAESKQYAQELASNIVKEEELFEITEMILEESGKAEKNYNQ